jgi:predicted phosphodiesterase
VHLKVPKLIDKQLDGDILQFFVGHTHLTYMEME